MKSAKYKIENSEIIGKALPFYARGRKLSLLIDAICHPLSTLHKYWMEMAEEAIIEASITSQPLSLTWYLNHKFNKYFINTEDSFSVFNGLDTPSSFIFTESEYFNSDEYSQHVYNESEERELLTMVTLTANEASNLNANFTIVAPAITETSTYNKTNYNNDIAKIVNKYNTSFKTYKIDIQ